MSSYFAVDRRAVLDFFNPVKSEQFMVNYYNKVLALYAHDQYSIECLRFIYLVLSFQSLLQVYLYLFPFEWHRLILFDMFDQSNNYPNLFKINLSAVFLMAAYMFHVLYSCFGTEKCFRLLYDYYMNDAKTFVQTPSVILKKVVITTLNAYQVFVVVAMYLSIEYTVFTFRIFRSTSLLVWSEWMEFTTMSIFFLVFASALCLFIFISNTCIAGAIGSVGFLVFRFRETRHQLSHGYCRFTTLRLLRFVHRNIGTMQYIFSLNRLFGSILLAFMSANLPSNVMIATFLLQNRFPAKQRLFMYTLFAGQLTCFLGVHLVAAAFSKRIHSPYKRFQSLYIRIRRCPLKVRIQLANSIQSFHVKNKKYGVTYGAGKLTIGLVTMVSFTKFILLYGKQLMYQYNHLQPSE